MIPGQRHAPHSRAAHVAITGELVRLTVGGRGPQRPELLAPVLDDRTQHARRRPTRRRTR